jgi:ERF superfamily
MSAVVEMTPEPRRNNKAVAVASNVDIVQTALKSGNVEMYREAVALFKELEGMAARKAFDNAMADAKAEIPVIRKNRHVYFESKNGGATTDYRHEDLAEIARTVDPILSKFGLSYRFRVASPINEPVSVTCVISHRDGHFEETTLTAGRDDDKSGKNSIQRIGSTVTYLQRYSLKAALGLAAAADDDGQSSQQQAEPEVYTPPAGSITQDQVDFIRDALREKGASVSAFLQWAGKKRIEDIPAGKYAACINAIANYKPAK